MHSLSVQIRRSSLVVLVFASILAAAAPGQAAAPDTRKTENVILVTLDGLRWQEVFAGADEAMMNDDFGKVKDLPRLKRRYERPTATERREVLMPFLWNTIAKHGTLLGNPEDDSEVVVTNRLNFSYPGYSEILCGVVDPGIDSNSKINNPNVTVLEWLSRREPFRGHVAAFCSWDVFPFIINEERSGISVNAGWEPLASGAGENSAVLRELDEIGSELPQYWDNVRYDYFTFRGAQECLTKQRPRVLYVSLGETDDWAHAGRYDLYLDAAWHNDDYIRRLWETAQSLPQYRDKTSLVITTDHGRGPDRVEWKNHGEDVPDCERIWIAVLGPDTDPGAAAIARATQSQVAATVAALLGLDFRSDIPAAAPPLPVCAVP
ncbi:MAG: hypothetical protein R3C19_02720 [Planctomycetaceae bacterium]